MPLPLVWPLVAATLDLGIHFLCSSLSGGRSRWTGTTTPGGPEVATGPWLARGRWVLLGLLVGKRLERGDVARGTAGQGKGLRPPPRDSLGCCVPGTSHLSQTVCGREDRVSRPRQWEHIDA